MAQTIDYSNAGYTGTLQAAYARNAAGLRTLLDRAEKTGRKVNGYTAEELRHSVAECERLSTLDQPAMLAHLSECRMRVANRLAELRRA